MKTENRAALIAISAGLVLALLIAALATFADWYENPAGIFRSEQGTSWNHVLETFISWFWPFALLGLPVAAVCYVAVRWRVARQRP